MRRASSSAISIKGQAVLLVDGACPLILVIMSSKGHIHLHPGMHTQSVMSDLACTCISLKKALRHACAFFALQLIE